MRTTSEISADLVQAKRRKDRNAIRKLNIELRAAINATSKPAKGWRI